MLTLSKGVIFIFEEHLVFIGFMFSLLLLVKFISAFFFTETVPFLPTFALGRDIDLLVSSLLSLVERMADGSVAKTSFYCLTGLIAPIDLTGLFPLAVLSLLPLLIPF